MRICVGLRCQEESSSQNNSCGDPTREQTVGYLNQSISIGPQVIHEILSDLRSVVRQHDMEMHKTQVKSWAKSGLERSAAAVSFNEAWQVSTADLGQWRVWGFSTIDLRSAVWNSRAAQASYMCE